MVIGLISDPLEVAVELENHRQLEIQVWSRRDAHVDRTDLEVGSIYIIRLWK